MLIKSESLLNKLSTNEKVFIGSILVSMNLKES